MHSAPRDGAKLSVSMSKAFDWVRFGSFSLGFVYLAAIIIDWTAHRVLAHRVSISSKRPAPTVLTA